jgi:autotransporter adhesin|nr:MAG TPA: YadA-like protein [Caudoviricetes sp.]
MKHSVIALAIAAVSMPVLAENVVNVTGKTEIYGTGHVVLGHDQFVVGQSHVNIGRNNQIGGKVSTVIGQQAESYGNMNVVAGFKAYSEENMTVAIGSGSRVTGNSATAVGKATLAEGKASAAFGSHATAKGEVSVAVGQHANALGGYSTAVGQASVAKAQSSTAIGSGATAESRFSTAIGTNAHAKNYQDVAVGFGSTTTTVTQTAKAEVNGVTYGTFAGHRPSSAASFGSKGNERQLQNVAAGQVTSTSTDAVNGSQLYVVAGQASNNTIRIEQNSAKIETVQAIATQYNNQQTNWNTTQDVQIAELKKLTEGFLARQDGFEKALHDQRREARAGVAGANAIAIIPQAYQPGQSSIGMGVGGFKHEGAVAVGVSHISESGRWVSKAGLNYDTRRNFGAAIGLSYVFGGVAKAPAQPVVVKEVVREVVVREVPAAPVPATVKIRQ